MKALSVRQPWAWAILHAGKDIENRTWPTKYRGTIFLHTGLQWDRGVGMDDILDIAGGAPEGVTIPLGRDLPRGAIIGRVDIVDCVSASDSPWFCGPFGFVLKNPVAFPSLIPCPGKLGFFDPPEAAFHAALFEPADADRT